MQSDFGLRPSDIDLILKILNSYPQIDKVFIYGSRALGNYKKESDIDLAILGENITMQVLASLYSELDELPLPYFFDLLHYKALNNAQLKEHIDQHGQVLYDGRDNLEISKP